MELKDLLETNLAKKGPGVESVKRVGDATVAFNTTPVAMSVFAIPE